MSDYCNLFCYSVRPELVGRLLFVERCRFSLFSLTKRVLVKYHLNINLTAIMNLTQLAESVTHIFGTLYDNPLFVFVKENNISVRIASFEHVLHYPATWGK